MDVCLIRLEFRVASRICELGIFKSDVLGATHQAYLITTRFYGKLQKWFILRVNVSWRCALDFLRAMLLRGMEVEFQQVRMHWW